MNNADVNTDDILYEHNDGENFMQRYSFDHETDRNENVFLDDLAIRSLLESASLENTKACVEKVCGVNNAIEADDSNLSQIPFHNTSILSKIISISDLNESQNKVALPNESAPVTARGKVSINVCEAEVMIRDEELMRSMSAGGRISTHMMIH